MTRKLVDAKAAVLSLHSIPYQRGWVEELQKMAPKREVAGTSRIEGAEFTEEELDAALRESESPEQLHTRSQREARAALEWPTEITESKFFEYVKSLPKAKSHPFLR